MEFEKLIRERRSIGVYKNAPVDKKAVEEIIAAAQQAPSWKNSQTGRYYAVMSDEKVKYVREHCLPEFNQKNTADAPVYIITAFEKGIAGFDNDKNAVNELGDKWGAYDLGLQNENMILKARELGLDTLIMGIRDEKALRAELNIPDTQEVVAVIALGYRNTEPSAPKRKDIAEIAKFY